MRKAVAKTKEENNEEVYTVKLPKISQMSLPKFSLGNHKMNYTPVLTVLLIVESLFLGSFYTQVQDLRGGGSTAMAAGTTTQTAGTAAQPQVTTAPVVAQVDNGHFPVRGDANAPVTIIEFADFRCPFCKQIEDNVMPSLQKDYIDTGKVKLYFRQYDFLGPASTVAANAAECANDQGKFWDYHDYLYKNQPDETDTSMYTTDNLTTIAGQLGLDTTQFNSCLSANTDNSKVTDDFNAGQKAGVSGTPTFYINGTQLVGAEPYSVFQQTIDAALKKS